MKHFEKISLTLIFGLLALAGIALGCGGGSGGGSEGGDGGITPDNGVIDLGDGGSAPPVIVPTPSPPPSHSGNPGDVIGSTPT